MLYDEMQPNQRFGHFQHKFRRAAHAVRRTECYTTKCSRIRDPGISSINSVGLLTRFAGRNVMKKTMGDTTIVFVLLAHVYLTYTLVGTGETYFAALAALNLFVSRETFLEAACFLIVPLAAACISFFSASFSFSAACSKSPDSIALSML